jgi:hypothetical protein
MAWRATLFRDLEARPADYESLLAKADHKIYRLKGAERKKFFAEAQHRFPEIYLLTAFSDRDEGVRERHARQMELWGWCDLRPEKKARKTAKPETPLP